MNKIKNIVVFTGLFTLLHVSAGAQPPPPGGPSSTTAVPLDPVSVLLLAGAAALKLKAQRNKQSNQ